MKRFGVQIAAVAVVVLLAALAAAQAQKDSQIEGDSGWDLASMTEPSEPPAPIADLGESASTADAEQAETESAEPEPGGAESASGESASTGPSDRHGDSAVSDFDPPAGAGNPSHPENPNRQASSPSERMSAGDLSAEAIRLVQHTETEGAEAQGSQADAPGGQDASQSAGPAFGMAPPAFAGSPKQQSAEDSAGPDAPALAFGTPQPTSAQDGRRPEEKQGDPRGGADTNAQTSPGGQGAGEAASPAGGMSMPAGFGFGGGDAAGAERTGDATATNGEDRSRDPGAAAGRDDASAVSPPGGAPASETPGAQLGEPPAISMGSSAQPLTNESESGSDAAPRNVLRGGPSFYADAPSASGTDTGASGGEPAGAATNPMPSAAGNAAFGSPADSQASAEPDRFGNAAAEPATSGPEAAPQPEMRPTPGGSAAQDVSAPDAYAAPDAYTAPAPRGGTPQPDEHLAGASLDASAGAPGRARADEPTPMAQPNVATPLPSGNGDADETVASPGDRRLEGAQSPSVVIQKRAPEEVTVGKPAAFVIEVQNVGAVEALDVQVHDRVPAGMRLVEASPEPDQQGDRLMWQLGALSAGEQRTVMVRLVPEQEGELGSVARVSFEAAASVRTISTRPELKIVQRAPEQVLIGQQLEIELEVSNPGTGAATGVILQEDVPQGLEHPKGRQLDNLLGTLRPGETRREVLRLRAVEPGVIENVVQLVGDDGLTAEHRVQVEVIAPQLQVELNGPSRRFLERQATYEIQLANRGTADATNVELAAYLDRGFTFVSTGNQGQYDSTRHAVFWSLAELPRSESGSVELTLLPVEAGDHAIRLETHGDLNVRAEAEHTVAVDSLAELTFQLSDAADPIEVGSETTYEIRVRNSGSKNDGNVQVQMQLPAGLELVSSDAQAETDGQGNVFFQPRGELPAGGEIAYQVRVRGVKPGTHVAKATITSDQSGVPVTKEESTMVYSDR